MVIQRAIGAIAIIFLLFLAVAIAGPLGDVSENQDERITRDAGLLEDTSTFTSLNDGKGTNQTVFKTTGFAVNLTGADDSFVQSSESFDITDDANWTVSVWARVDSASATENMTALSLDGRVIISYNGTQGNWSAWYFDDGSRNSYRVNVTDAGDQPGNYTNIIVRSNDSELTIYRNNTPGDTADVTADNIVRAPVNDTNWDGRLEEVRTFGEPLNTSKRQELVDSPVEQQPAISPTARIMFDQPNQDTQLLLYGSGAIQQSNVTFSQGHPEQIVSQGTDYEWREHGPAIRPIAGGALAGAPVAYASYDFGGRISNSLITDFATAIGLAALIGVLIVLGIILSVMGRV